MKRCPPQPGLTLMHRIRSATSASALTASAGVPGLRANPASAPPSWIAVSVRWALASASTWIVTESAPAATNSATWRCGASIIR
jgi:hypothetical protein